MTGRRIIGLSGYAGSGKDTAAAVLLEQGWSRVSFADVLREFLYAQDLYLPRCGLRGVFRPRRLNTLVDAHGWQHVKATEPSVRALLQRTGTEAGRGVLGSDVWVDAAFERAPAGDLVVTDVRFPNEFDAIKARHGTMVRVERPGTRPVNAHKSETALDGHPFDATLVNVGTVGTLMSQLLTVAETVPAA